MARSTPPPPLLSSHTDETATVESIPVPAVPVPLPSVPIPSSSMPNTTIKLDNVKPLKGSENYEAWASHVSLVLFAIGAKDLVISGVGMTLERENALLQQAIVIII